METDAIEQQKLHSMAEFRRGACRSSIRALPALFSTSFFLLLFLLLLLSVSLSSWLPCLLHRADVHWSQLLNDLPDRAWADRKTIFLVCNLIMVVIALDSGLLACFIPERDPLGEFSVRREGHLRPEGDTSKLSSVARFGPTLQVRATEHGSKPEEEEEEEDEGEKCHDMDELKRKFDDFIEKVKTRRKLEEMQMGPDLKRRELHACSVFIQ